MEEVVDGAVVIFGEPDGELVSCFGVAVNVAMWGLDMPWLQIEGRRAGNKDHAAYGITRLLEVQGTDPEISTQDMTLGMVN